MWGFGQPYRESFGLFDCDDGGAVSRSDWKTKSDAASRRERHANALFDAFLQKCCEESRPSSDFPITEEVVKANIHLTSACYTSFRKRVIATGCKVHRREATVKERIESKDKRQGKLYVISITCPFEAVKRRRMAKDAAPVEPKTAQRKAALHREKCANITQRGGEVVLKRKMSQSPAVTTKEANATVVITPSAGVAPAKKKSKTGTIDSFFKVQAKKNPAN
ncbi:MAG: hypothetical protein SGILL_010167 [Bacillariaceae sp.]